MNYPSEGGSHAGFTWSAIWRPEWHIWNGYVEIPRGHPWHGVEFEQIDIHVLDGYGLSYSGYTGSGKFLIGFDSGHADTLDMDRKTIESECWSLCEQARNAQCHKSLPNTRLLDL